MYCELRSGASVLGGAIAPRVLPGETTPCYGVAVYERGERRFRQAAAR